MNEPSKLKKPSKIFTVDMGDIFGDWVPEEWIVFVLDVIKLTPWHTFQLLTKNPKRLLYNDSGGKRQYSPNVWVGVIIDSNDTLSRSNVLKSADARIKFISFEPLLTPIKVSLETIDRIIIEAQTNPLRLPEKEWVEYLIAEARRCGSAVFLKNNLGWNTKIQEFPTTQEMKSWDKK